MIKPVIGLVTGRRDENGNPIVNPNISARVTERGGEILPFNYDSMTDAEIEKAVSEIDGFVFPGGGDMEPALYGRERLPECGASDKNWDALEWKVMPLLRARRLPVMGICRGCQAINAILGGTLLQDLPSQRGVCHRQDDSKGRYSHDINILPGTRLSEIVKTGSLTVNSYHHQAVDDIAPGFTVSARAADGTVEAIEPENRDVYIIGLQWHPEVLPEDPASQAIFDDFINITRAYAESGR